MRARPILLQQDVPSADVDGASLATV